MPFSFQDSATVVPQCWWYYRGRDSRLRLTQLLQNDGHTVEQADDGDIPLACKRWSPDVVLMVVATPDVSGL